MVVDGGKVEEREVRGREGKVRGFGGKMMGFGGKEGFCKGVRGCEGKE